METCLNTEWQQSPVVPHQEVVGAGGEQQLVCPHAAVLAHQAAVAQPLGLVEGGEDEAHVGEVGGPLEVVWLHAVTAVAAGKGGARLSPLQSDITHPPPPPPVPPPTALHNTNTAQPTLGRGMRRYPTSVQQHVTIYF